MSVFWTDYHFLHFAALHYECVWSSYCSKVASILMSTVLCWIYIFKWLLHKTINTCTINVLCYESFHIYNMYKLQISINTSGATCARTCPTGRWGENCTDTCSCVRGECDRVTGTCDCPPGYTGVSCQSGESEAVFTNLFFLPFKAFWRNHKLP